MGLLPVTIFGSIEGHPYYGILALFLHMPWRFGYRQAIEQRAVFLLGITIEEAMEHIEVKRLAKAPGAGEEDGASGIDIVENFVDKLGFIGVIAIFANDRREIRYSNRKFFLGLHTHNLSLLDAVFVDIIAR